MSDIDLGPLLSDQDRKALIAARRLRPYHRFDEADVAAVKAMIEKGLTYREIFERFPFKDIDNTRRFCNRHCLPRVRKAPRPATLSQYNRNSGETLEKVRLLVHAGKTTGEIALIMKVSKNAICGVIWRFGLRALRQRPDEGFKTIYGSHKPYPNPQGKSSPDLAAVAAGPGHSPRVPGPVCSYRGVSLAHV